MRTVPRKTRPKPKSMTKAQRRAAWERTVIEGGVVRASKLPRTAGVINRGRGALVRILAVPLLDDRQMNVLRDMANEGIVGQTPEECAAYLITWAIVDRAGKHD